MDINSKTIVFIIIGFIVFFVVSHLLATSFAARCAYLATLRRKNKDTWSRTPSDPTDLQKKMFESGFAWHDKNISDMQEVHIVNNGLNLYGEYYDFGFDKCVIILSGRTESLTYGYYFAQPYHKFGMNVLVIDPRAHGKSDGRFNTVGFEESKDALAWSKFLHEEHNINSVFFHGICIGAAAGILALTSDECPDYICGIVTEGMFPNFGESMKNHLIERKKMIFPIFQCMDFWMKRYTNHSMKFGPIDVIGKYTKPLLMLHSKEDAYSLPVHAQKMFDVCPSSNKNLVWFEKGRHSMLRITDTEKYDNAIASFLSESISLAKK